MPGRWFVSLVLLLACPHPALAAPSRIDAALARISRARIAEDIAALAALGSRDATAPGFQRATDLVRQRLEQTGLPVTLDPVAVGEVATAHNVTATIKGSLAGRPVLLLTAHYDSIAFPAGSAAPGAEDNASGTAALLAIARALAPERLATGVRLVAFAAEEHGLWGSRHLAQKLGSPDSVSAAINMDMVGYHVGPPEALLDGYRSGRSLAGRLAWHAARHAALPCSAGIFSAGHSDHRPFAELGIPALTVASVDHASYPHYHTDRDLPRNVDAEMVARIARAVAAHALLSAGFADGPPVARASDFVYTTVGSPVVIDGRASFDPQGDELSLKWHQLDGPAAGLDGTQGEELSFRPERTGVYRFLLTARSGDGRTSEPALAAVIVTDPAGCRLGQRGVSGPLSALVVLLLLIRLRSRRRFSPARRGAAPR